MEVDELPAPDLYDLYALITISFLALAGEVGTGFDDDTLLCFFDCYILLLRL